MASFDYCKKCEFPRFIEGYGGIADYITNGWVMFITETNRHDKNGITFQSSVSTWLCPVCADIEAAEREALMDIGSVRQYNRRGVLVDERSS